MAAFHFTVKIHSRAKGASAVRAAAYRAAERLHDQRAGKTEDYSRKSDVYEAAIFAPEGAPARMLDRASLWNAVEAREKRRDAQLAQEIEINLPRELTDGQNWQILTDFVHLHLVKHGRLCDVAMHVGEASDGEAHPHAHILMPMRAIAGDGFGEKHPDCDWRKFLNRRDRLGELRAAWSDFARARAAELGIDLGPDWDHRSFTDRGIDLEGQPKRGATAQRLDREGEATDRAAEILEAQRRNGKRLLDRPDIVLEALTQRQSTFTEADLARWIHRHSADDQFAGILAAAKDMSFLVGIDEAGRERFSTAEMIALERRMVDEAQELAARGGHRVGHVQLSERLSHEQRAAAHHVLEAGDLACLVGFAGSGKSTMLAEVRQALEGKGFRVRGAALSGIAAENLTQGSGIEARTIASLTYAWEHDRDPLARGDVLVVDEAGMIGSRELSQLIARASDVGAKIILVGDPEQLQAIDAGAAFRAVMERTGAAELTEIRRQQIQWQQEATRELATGQTAAALARYQAAGCIRQADTDEEARSLLVEQWKSDRAEDPEASRIMLAHTRADVRELNEEARAHLRAGDELGDDVAIATSRGERNFAAGDRLLFLRNERELGVRNGTLGEITEVSAGRITVRADDGRMIAIDPRAYRDIDHGYAVTVHKSQGVTVDRSYIHAGRGFDRHLAYVAGSRHRQDMMMVHSREAFPADHDLARVLGRERAKDTTLDYREPSASASLDTMLALARAESADRRRRDRELGRDRGLER